MTDNGVNWLEEFAKRARAEMPKPPEPEIPPEPEPPPIPPAQSHAEALQRLTGGPAIANTLAPAPTDREVLEALDTLIRYARAVK